MVSRKNFPNYVQASLSGTIALSLMLGEVKSVSANHVESYCESIGGTLNPTNLFTEADNGTFGVGTAADQTSPLSPSDLTTYTYDANYPPSDGEYTVSTETTVEGFGTWHDFAGHTTEDATDRFLVINANELIVDTEMIQSSVISGLTPNTNYTFTAYILNTVEDNPSAHIDPNISYGIDLVGIDDDEDGTIDEDQEIEVRFSSGAIPESITPTWVQYAFLFNTGDATSARFIIRNNVIGGFGNDLAIDDITLRGCDLTTGNLEGNLYYDTNLSGDFDNGETGLPPGLTVRLIDDQGTTETTDDVVITRLANPGGSFSFLNIPVGNNYRIEAPDDDGSGNAIRTTNPLTNISITANTTTTDQDFGYLGSGSDYGDAPIDYDDTADNDAIDGGDDPARHEVVSNLYLGTVAADADTPPLNSTDASQDDTSVAIDDEDAFDTLPEIPLTGNYDLTVPLENTSGNNATLHAWIDFDQDGKFESGEYQSVAVNNNAASANLSWTVPSGLNFDDTTYARFRLTTDTLTDDGSTTDIDERSVGQADDGEVEDYQVEVEPALDYGDAPIDYDDTVDDDVIDSSDDPARHAITSSLYFGAVAPDEETASQSSTDADGDNSNGDDDEDGISSFPELDTDDTSYSLTATIENSSGTAANVYAWIDFDLDGEFDEDERATVTDGTISLVSGQVPTGSSGTVTLNWSNIGSTGADITDGDNYVRLRLATDDLDITTETTERDDASVGIANNGEVEDYPIAIANVSLCPTARADLWFANDESGSVDSGEFDDALDFIYQVSDQFEYGETAGIKAGIIGWASNTPTSSNHIIIPITDTFGDPGDTGLIADSNISTDGDNQGVREEYTAKVVSSSGTRLDRATSYLASIITMANGRRVNTPQVAIILTDASESQITNASEGGDFRWESAAFDLKDPVDGAGASIVLIIIDDAADAYNAGGDAKTVIDNVVGTDGRLLIVPSYQDAADATKEYITLASQAVCDSTTPVASDPELLLTKRITAINPEQSDEVSFTDFVDDDTEVDNNSKWPNSVEGSGTFTNTYTVGETNGGEVVPDDVLEYTIYFLSSGDDTANDVLVCDLVPENTEFVTNDFDTESPATGGTTGIDRGILWEYNGNIESLTNDNDGDAGYYFAPGIEPSTVFPDIKCSDSNLPNTNGAVVIDLGDIPQATDSGTPTNSSGFIRFRAKVK